MKIQYCSDLHLEFEENRNFLKQFPIEPVGDILILAGDIIPFKSLKLADDFFEFCAESFQSTYWIPGNHEYYHSDIALTEKTLYETIRQNVFLLNNKTLILEEFELIFATLWSRIEQQNEKNIQRNVNDFHLIQKHGKRLTAADFNKLHEEGLDFLTTTLANPTNKKRVIVTHHVPTLMNYPEHYRKSEINNAFAVELHDFIEKNDAAFWIYGHHHCNTPPFTIGNTILLTNQLGYVSHNEHRLFNPTALIPIY